MPGLAFWLIKNFVSLQQDGPADVILFPRLTQSRFVGCNAVAGNLIITSMDKISQKYILLILFVLNISISHGQKNIDKTTNSEILPTLRDDTLYIDETQKIYVGQQLNVGEPSGANGQFRSIISKKAAIVPSIWGQDKRYEYAIENYVDSKRNKEKLTIFLQSAKSLTIKKIKMAKIGKPYFYLIVLSSETEECSADIELALKLKELSL
jgi:hypothetical protein